MYPSCATPVAFTAAITCEPLAKITVTTTATGTKEYRLDVGDWQTTNAFTDVPYGKHTVSVKVTNGSTICYGVQVFNENAFDACGKLNCDGIVIVAKDDANNETNTIPRGTNKTLKTLNLSAISLDNADLSKGITYLWERRAMNTGGGEFVAFSSTQAAVSIGVPGRYTLKMVRGTTTCTTEIAINAKPCTETPDPTGAVVCTTPALTAVANEAANRLTNLAPGDVVRCGDFNIIIIEATGSANGWSGKGYVKVPYLNAQVSIILRNAVFNDCYQLTNSNATAELPTVYTEYDPKWGSITDVDNVLANFKSSLQGVIDIMNNFSGKCEDVRALDKAVKEYEQGFSQPNSTYTEAERTAILAKIAILKTKRDQLVSCSSCSVSGRIAAANDATVDCGPKAIECRDALKDMLGNAKEKNEDYGDTKRLNTLFAIYKNPTKIASKYPNFYNGAVVAIVINSYYKKNSNQAHKITYEYAIPESSINGNQGYADILNLTTGEIFEVKPFTQENAGKVQLDRYINKATSKCGVPPDWKTGNSVFPVGESNAIRQNIVLDNKKKVLYFWMSQNFNGVVLYRLEDVNDDTPWYDVFNFPEAIDAMKLLLAASMTKIKQVTKVADIPALKEELLTKFVYVMKRLPTATVKNLAILAGGTFIIAILANAIPGFQYGAAVATVFVGVVGIVAYEELKHRPES